MVNLGRVNVLRAGTVYLNAVQGNVVYLTKDSVNYAIDVTTRVFNSNVNLPSFGPGEKYAAVSVDEYVAHKPISWRAKELPPICANVVAIALSNKTEAKDISANCPQISVKRYASTGMWEFTRDGQDVTLEDILLTIAEG